MSPRALPRGPSAYVKAMAKQGHQNEPNTKLTKFIICAIIIKNKRDKMNATQQIFSEYIKFIGDKVVTEFGGSYQNYQTMGKIWRQQLNYTPAAEDFIIRQTKYFLIMVNDRYQKNFNMMYKVCTNIAEHLSKYLVKKSPDLTRKVVAERVLKTIFLESDRFIAKFKSMYKKPIDTSNPGYVISNPGIMAMLNTINNIKR